MSVRYFRNDIVIMFISELTWELMSVALVFTTDVFNEFVILSLWVDIESCENEIQNSKNNRAVKKILLFCFCFSTHWSSSFFLLQLLQLIKMLFFFLLLFDEQCLILCFCWNMIHCWNWRHFSYFCLHYFEFVLWFLLSLSVSCKSWDQMNSSSDQSIFSECQSFAKVSFSLLRYCIFAQRETVFVSWRYTSLLVSTVKTLWLE